MYWRPSNCCRQAKTWFFFACIVHICDWLIDIFIGSEVNMQYIGLGRSHERKPREMFCFESYLKIKVLAKSNILLIRINTYINSLEIIGLCLMNWRSEKLQNLPYFWNTKTYIIYFIFHFIMLLHFNVMTNKCSMYCINRTNFEAFC